MGKRKKVKDLTGATLGERLRIFIKKKGLTIKEFAEACGISDKSIINYVTDQRQPNAEALKKMAEKFPDLDLRWLLLGSAGTGVSESESKEWRVEVGEEVEEEKREEKEGKEDLMEELRIIEEAMKCPADERYIYLMKEIAKKFGMQVIFSGAFYQAFKKSKKNLETLKDLILAYEDIKSFFERVVGKSS